MRANRYLPRKEAEIIHWCQNFLNFFPEQAVALGFSESDIARVTGVCNDMINDINAVLNAHLVYEEKVSIKNQTQANWNTIISESVHRIKAAPVYTEAIGRLLGVIGEGRSFDPNSAAPAVTLVRNATGWEFRYSLMNYFSGVAVFRRNPGETDFTRVGTDLQSPYPIASPPISGVEYYFQYVKGDKLIGQPSNIIMMSL